MRTIRLLSISMIVCGLWLVNMAAAGKICPARRTGPRTAGLRSTPSRRTTAITKVCRPLASGQLASSDSLLVTPSASSFVAAYDNDCPESHVFEQPGTDQYSIDAIPQDETAQKEQCPGVEQEIHGTTEAGPHVVDGSLAEPSLEGSELMPFSPAPAAMVMQSAATFVHERRTVRVSERMAEIWVTLPEDTQSSVSVNHVEYPPEGEFRIFRTKLNSLEPQRFYLTAKSWDPNANRWVKLGQVPSPQSGIMEEVGYVTLVPGQCVEVQFAVAKLPDAPHLAQAQPPASVPQCELEAALAKHIDPINKRLDGFEAKLNILDTATTTLNTAAGQLDSSSNALLEHLDKLELAAAPHANSAKVTNWFQFDSATQKFSGDFASDVNGQLTVNWPDQPAAVVIKVPNRISPMPPRPFTANVTFLIREKEMPPVFNKTIAVTFNDLGDQVVATIPFQQSLASPLQDALLNEIKAAGTFRISATIQYDAALGELGSVQIDGPLGNEIDLTITP